MASNNGTSTKLLSLYELSCDEITKSSNSQRFANHSVPRIVRFDIEQLAAEKRKLDVIIRNLEKEVAESRRIYLYLKELEKTFQTCRNNHQTKYTLGDNSDNNRAFNLQLNASGMMARQLSRSASLMISVNESGLDQFRRSGNPTPWTLAKIRTEIENYHYDLADNSDFRSEVNSFTTQLRDRVRKKLVQRRPYLRRKFTNTCKNIRAFSNLPTNSYHVKKTSNISLYLKLQEQFKELNAMEKDFQSLTSPANLFIEIESFKCYEKAFTDSICLLGRLKKHKIPNESATTKRTLGAGRRSGSMELRKRS